MNWWVAHASFGRELSLAVLLTTKGAGTIVRLPRISQITFKDEQVSNGTAPPAGSEFTLRNPHSGLCPAAFAPLCTLALLVLLGVGMSGCATLQGIPEQLSADDVSKFSDTDLKANIAIARELALKWQTDRNTSYKWAFWSNASLIPLAVGGAGAALYKGSTDLVIGFGLAAGAVAGTNAFIGAADIGAAYQAGINGLNCVATHLGPYVASSAKSSEAQLLHNAATALQKEVDDANKALLDSMSLDLTKPPASEELKTNPTVVNVLAVNEKVLTQAIIDANAAINSALTEFGVYNEVAKYARDRIFDIDNLIGNRIKPKTVSYASLSASLNSTAPATPPKLTPSGGTAKSPQSPAPPVHKAGAPAVAVAPPTPIADAAKATKSAADNLATPTKNLGTATSNFGLSAQENDVATCIKNL